MQEKESTNYFFLNWQFCCSEEIEKSKFNSMIGLVHRERVDEELYDDYESTKAREVCAWLLLEFSFILRSTASIFEVFLCCIYCPDLCGSFIFPEVKITVCGC